MEKKSQKKMSRIKKSRYLHYLFIYFHICKLKKGICISSTLSFKDGPLSVFQMHIPNLWVEKIVQAVT